MTNSLDRRRFIRNTAIGCAGITATATGAFLLMDRGRHEPPGDDALIRQIRNFSTDSKDSPASLVISRGAPGPATEKAIATLGGMERFINPGDSVVIKPNIGWDRTPVQAANTNPHVVAALVRMCFSAGASGVVVTDNSCNDPARCFTRSGIWKLAEAAGAEVILPAPHRFRTLDLGGVILGKMPVLMPAVSATRFINVPIAKHHGLSGFTGAMKNLYGILGGRRNRLHQRIDDSIADLADFIRPTLTVMDASRVLFRNGPQGGDLADTREVGEIIVSTDPVAVDAYSCTLIGLNPADLPFLALAEKRGLGTADPAGVSREEVG